LPGEDGKPVSWPAWECFSPEAIMAAKAVWRAWHLFFIFVALVHGIVAFVHG
jgi:hypothetical protein